MVREDLVNSAVSFLQDPSVANASPESRIAFLQSKNLTQEEINISLARAGGEVPAGAVQSQQGYGSTQGPPPPGYGQYPGYWQMPPPEVPRRDWRDWFIMATVMGGVGFGLYVTAKRYIIPLIKPPTPEQLTQDKDSIDESFTKAFTLLEQLETDTKSLKEAEEQRTQRLDSALTDLENVINSLKDSDRKREDDSRRNTDEIRMLRDLIPKALESEKNATESKLRDLTTELRSLKTLMGNRIGNAPTPATSGHRQTPSFGTNSTPAAAPNSNAPATTATPAAPAAPTTNGSSAPAEPTATPTGAEASKASAPSSPPKPSFPRFGSGKGAAIPAWQMAAAKKSQEDPKVNDTSASGTVEEEQAPAS